MCPNCGGSSGWGLCLACRGKTDVLAYEHGVKIYGSDVPFGYIDDASRKANLEREKKKFSFFEKD